MGIQTIHVDEGQFKDEDDPPFEPRNVKIRTDRWVTKDFEILDFLGRGKFGEVKRCREISTTREFAAKFICAPRPQDKKDVEHEMVVMMKLQHKRLLQLYDAFQCKDEMCLVLEIILGGELFDRVILDDFILTERACMAFMRQICEGVEYMTSKNIIHLDLKPENILCLTRTGNRIKIIDFGLAREYDPKGELRVLFGTPEFMAPEVVQFDPIDFSTDMWSVGVICYVLLSGLSPFMGDNDGETLANVTKGAFDFDYAEFEDVSEDAKDLITKLLLKDQRKRLTATQCLEHPWLRRKSPFERQLQLSKKRLKRFVYRRKWQKIVNAIIALKRMGVQLTSLSEKEGTSTEAKTPESLFGWETTATKGPGHGHSEPASDASPCQEGASLMEAPASDTTPCNEEDGPSLDDGPISDAVPSKGAHGSSLVDGPPVVEVEHEINKDMAPEIVVNDTLGAEMHIEDEQSNASKGRSPSPRPFTKDSTKRVNRWGKDHTDKTLDLSEKSWQRKKSHEDVHKSSRKNDKDLSDLSRKNVKCVPDLPNKSPKDLLDISRKKSPGEVTGIVDSSKNMTDEMAVNVTCDLADLSHSKSPRKNRNNNSQQAQLKESVTSDLPEVSLQKNPQKKVKSDIISDMSDLSKKKSPGKKNRYNQFEKSSLEPKKEGDSTLPDLTPQKPPDMLNVSADRGNSLENKAELKNANDSKISESQSDKDLPNSLRNKSPDKKDKFNKLRTSSKADKETEDVTELSRNQLAIKKDKFSKWQKPHLTEEKDTTHITNLSGDKIPKKGKCFKEESNPDINLKTSDRKLRPWERTPERSPERKIRPWQRKSDSGLVKVAPDKETEPVAESKLKPWEKRKASAPSCGLDKNPEPERKLRPWEKKATDLSILQETIQEKSPSDISVKKQPSWVRKHSNAGAGKPITDTDHKPHPTSPVKKKQNPWEKKMEEKQKKIDNPGNNLKADATPAMAEGAGSGAPCEVAGVMTNVTWQAEPVITIVNDIVPSISCEHEVTAACVVLKPAVD